MKHKKEKKKKEEEQRHGRFNRKLIMIIIPVIAAAAIGIGIALSSSSLPAGNQGEDGNSSEDDSPEVEISTNPGVVVNSVNISRSNIIGNPTDIAENTGIVSLLLGETDQKISLRFTAKYSGTVEQVVVNLLAGDNFSSNIRAGLQADENFLPSGEWLGQPGLGGEQVDDWGFTKIELQQPATITKGKTYHLVIEPTDISDTDGVRVRTYQQNNLVLPLNDGNLDRLLPDPMIDVLFYDGQLWQEQNKWPIFVVMYSDGKSMGQPYSLAAPWIIYGPRYVGQEIIPSSDYVVKKFGFDVSLSGKPADKLYYEIRDSTNIILAKGVVGNATQISEFRKFFEMTLDSPVTLKKDETYRFVLLSPGSRPNNLYQLYGHEFTYDTTLSYGGLRNIMTITYDSGSTWIRWEDADAIFDLTTR